MSRVYVVCYCVVDVVPVVIGVSVVIVVLGVVIVNFVSVVIVFHVIRARIVMDVLLVIMSCLLWLCSWLLV